MTDSRREHYARVVPALLFDLVVPERVVDRLADGRTDKTTAVVVKLANEREKLQRPESASSDSNGGQFKLQQALLRRQQLLEKLKQEQLLEDQRARSCSPRPRRYRTPSTLPPPSRRSLPADLLRGLSRSYRFNCYNPQPAGDMVPTNYIVEHQVRPAEPIVTRREIALPAIYQLPLAPPPTQVTHVQAPAPVVQHVPSVTYHHSLPVTKAKDSPFNKADFMDMMMLQNAQMHHMVMQQMMLHNLPGHGSWSLPTAQVPLAPVRAAPMLPYASAPPAPVVHHMQTLPPMEPRYPSNTRAYNNPATFYDDGTNYFTYH